jgi:hypothetical protein
VKPKRLKISSAMPVLAKYKTLIDEMRAILVDTDIPLFTRYQKTKHMMIDAKVGCGHWSLVVALPP